MALIVTVDTYAQVDLPRIRIGPEEAHEAQNGVDRQALQTLQHLQSPSPRTVHGWRSILTPVTSHFLVLSQLACDGVPGGGLRADEAMILRLDPELAIQVAGRAEHDTRIRL